MDEPHQLWQSIPKEFKNELICTDYNTILKYILDRREIYGKFYFNDGNCNGKEYLNIIQELLMGCTGKFVVSNATLWFPIVHENDPQNSHQFVLDKLFKQKGKFSIALRSDFGTYISDYLVFVCDDAIQFPQQYIQFFKKSCGITWKLLP